DRGGSAIPLPGTLDRPGHHARACLRRIGAVHSCSVAGARRTPAKRCGSSPVFSRAMSSPVMRSSIAGIFWRTPYLDALPLPKEHRKHPFELSVKVDLVAAEPLQLVGVERLAKCLLSNQGTIGQFVLASFEPGSTSTSKKHRRPTAFAVAGFSFLSSWSGSSD